MGWEETQYGIDEIIKVTGLPPQSIKTFSVKNQTEDQSHPKILLSCTAPEDTIIDGQLLCSVGGVRIIRKEDSAPISPEDGKFIADAPVGEPFTYLDENVKPNTTYYYAFFPFSDHHVFNYTTYNSKSVTTEEEKVKFWAFDQNFADKNPATTISYPTGFTNETFVKMMTNEGNGETTAGDWLPFLQDTLKNFPFMVRKNGQADYAIDPDNYKLKKDGGNSDYNNLSYNGGAFAWINKIWMHEEYASDGKSREVQFSDGPEDGFLPIGFYDTEENELEGLWLPMGYTDSNGRVLIAGTAPTNNNILDTEKSIINSFSSRSVFLGGPIMNVLRDLEYMIFKSTNIQLAAGNGYSLANIGPNNIVQNAIVENGSVPGWKGTNNGNTRNKYFHSQVLGTYGYMLRDPYYLSVESNIKVSPYYKFDKSGNSYVIAAPNHMNTGVYVMIYPSYLIPGPKLWGSLVTDNDNQGSTQTGLTDGYLRRLGSAIGVGRRLGYTRDGADCGPAFMSVYHNETSADYSFGIGTLLLPPVEYTPFVDQIS